MLHMVLIRKELFHQILLKHAKIGTKLSRIKQPRKLPRKPTSFTEQCCQITRLWVNYNIQWKGCFSLSLFVFFFFCAGLRNAEGSMESRGKNRQEQIWWLSKCLQVEFTANLQSRVWKRQWQGKGWGTRTLVLDKYIWLRLVRWLKPSKWTKSTEDMQMSIRELGKTCQNGKNNTEVGVWLQRHK